MTDQISKRERYLLTVKGEETDRPPVWIMRQAGRYMPQFQELRKQYSFRDFCLNPEVAVAATLMPLEALDVDILIIFNDILIPLDAMGLKVEFPTGGPRILNPIRKFSDLTRFAPAAFPDPPVAHSLRLLKKMTGPEVPVLGFCGAPFTMAVYAIEGGASKNHAEIKKMMFRHPDLLEEVLVRLTDTTAAYLISQIVEGAADGVQIFESWGSILAMDHAYEEFAARWQRKLIGRVRKACPGVPIHLYVRGSSARLSSMDASGADVLSVDWSTPLRVARAATHRAIQGNLDPIVMAVESAVEREFARMIDGFDWRRGWIANLGHGITPDGNVIAAKRFVDCVKALA